MVFVNTVINRIFKIIACIILFSFYSFAQALPIEFERVHKAYIVNMHYVDTVCLKTNTINMKFDCSIKIGIAHKKNIAKYMKIS